MSIIANWDDIVPTNLSTVGSEQTTTTAGVFGNGHTGVATAWGFYRLGGIPLTLGAGMPKYTISSLCKILSRGSNPINIAGVGFCVDGTSLDSTIVGSTILDGRDASSSSPSAAAFQIRQISVNTGGVVVSQASASGSPLVVGNIYRLECDVSEVAGQLYCEARFYNHSNNQLITTLSNTRAMLSSSVMYPAVITYGTAVTDSTQLQVNNEAYLSNVPLKVRVGTSWTRKSMKKSKGGIFVPAYPRVVKNGQTLW